MGKEDSAIKQWLSDSVRFADLFNAVIFDGEQVVKPQELQKVDGESNIIIRNKLERVGKGKQKQRKKGIVVKRFRDIIMNWNNKVNLAVLACEAQSYVDYTMPFRAMIYDGLTYNEQKNNMWSELSVNKKKALTADEKLSSFRKKDKLVPVITIVFYYSEKEWDGPLQLHDILDVGDESTGEILKKYIPNYHINLVNLHKIDDFSSFKSDLQIIFNMLKCKKDKKKLYNYTIEHEEYFKHISNDSIRALGELLNARDLLESFIEEGKDEQDMCKALYDLINDSKDEGRQSERERLVVAFVNGAKRLGYEENAIKEALTLDYGLSDDEIVAVMK